MVHSDQINELAAALAEARKGFGTFGKGHTAKVSSAKGNYEYKYGNLPDMFDATTEALSANGLSVSQWPDLTNDGRFVLVTLLLHKSGQWMRGVYPLNTYERPQDQGSALTYAKKYAAGAALGIAADEDDDGAAAQKAKPVVAKPDGYDDWVTDLEAVADDGSAALQATWKASKPAFKKHLIEFNPDRWERIKGRAAAVDKAQRTDPPVAVDEKVVPFAWLLPLVVPVLWSLSTAG